MVQMSRKCLTVFLLPFYLYNGLYNKRQDIGRKSVETIGMIGGFLYGETDNKKEYGKAEPDVPTVGV